MKIAGIEKIKRFPNGKVMAYCPDCDRYIPLYNDKDELNFPKWKARGIGSYCRKHHAERQAKRNKEYYKKNRIKIYQQQKEYRKRVGLVRKGRYVKDEEV